MASSTDLGLIAHINYSAAAAAAGDVVRSECGQILRSGDASQPPVCRASYPYRCDCYFLGKAQVDSIADAGAAVADALVALVAEERGSCRKMVATCLCTRQPARLAPRTRLCSLLVCCRRCCCVHSACNSLMRRYCNLAVCWRCYSMESAGERRVGEGRAMMRLCSLRAAADSISAQRSRWPLRAPHVAAAANRENKNNERVNKTVNLN